MNRIRFVYLSLVILSVLTAFGLQPVAAQNEGKPFDMPIAVPAGPSTWLLGQPYGNTVGAFNRGSQWYEAGQQLHFGIDISMPCGTPLVAMADALVVGVDDLGFGSGPHNLILRHEEYGLTSLYGHLLERPPLVNGQRVTRGQEIALSGDPDGPSCDSRPHLHLEVRSLDYRTAYNPIEYINGAWHSLSNIGSFSSQNFQRDLDNARRWLTLLDQPPVVFGGRALNAYSATWPLPDEPPANPPLMRDLGELARFAPWGIRRLAYEGCCFWMWWHPSDGSRIYGIDGGEGQRAMIYEWQVGVNEQPTPVRLAPPDFVSPDGSIELRQNGEQTILRRVSDGTEWTVTTGGQPPAVNTDNTRLMWLKRSGVSIPGEEAPDIEVWISDLDGQNARMISTQKGGYAVWLDASRILLVASERQVSTVSIYNLGDDSTTTLGSWRRMRGLTVAPGGGRIMFYLAFQDDPAADGVYTMETSPGAQPEKLPWFGSWRWRDANSVYYIPFNPTTNQQILAYYHIPSGQDRPITDSSTPFTVANGDWSVSADGHRIAYLNAIDLTTWVIEEVNAVN